MATRFPVATAAVTVGTGLGISPLQADQHDTCAVDVSTTAPSGKLADSMKTIGWLVGIRLRVATAMTAGPRHLCVRTR